MNSYFLSIMITLLIMMVSANDANLGSQSGSVFPIGHTTVQMVNERVDITLHRDSISVQCAFTFFNHGNDTDVFMGFPAMSCTDQDAEPIRNFTSSINGKKGIVYFHENAPDEICKGCNESQSWYTWKWFAGKNASFTVINTYTGDIGVTAYGIIFSNYIIGTGNTWNRNISKGSIVFHHGNIASSLFRSSIDTNYYRKAGITITAFDDSVVFAFMELKPKCDQTVGIEFLGFMCTALKNSTLSDEMIKSTITEKMTRQQYNLMKNEIYARKGYIFNNRSLQNYFSLKHWYIPNGHFNDTDLSTFEKNLILYLKQTEESISPLQ